jgi:hypothetical protein
VSLAAQHCARILRFVFHSVATSVLSTYTADAIAVYELGWVKRSFGSFERRLNDINDGVVVWRVNDRLERPQDRPEIDPHNRSPARIDPE